MNDDELTPEEYADALNAFTKYYTPLYQQMILETLPRLFEKATPEQMVEASAALNETIEEHVMRLAEELQLGPNLVWMALVAEQHIRVLKAFEEYCRDSDSAMDQVLAKMKQVIEEKTEYDDDNDPPKQA